MIMFTRYILLLTSLLSSVLALPLAPRDVVSPPITSPTASTLWYVGQTQTVTWNTANLPVNQTNPVGMLILGYMYNNSENLNLNSPLATNLNYSVGQAQITVPDVPTGINYIVVLFGDSGNASPEFTIMNESDPSPSTSVPPIPLPSSTPGSSAATSAPASTPPANSNSPGNTGGSSSTPTTGSSTTGVLPTTSTAPSSQITTSSAIVTVTSSATPSSTQSNAAWQKHAPSLEIPLAVTLASIYFAFS